MATMSESPASAASASFSPIALFECTLGSAQLLLDSMELADLVLALRLVSQLHGRLVECVEPTAGRVLRLANLYARHAAEIREDESAEADDIDDSGAGDAAAPAAADVDADTTASVGVGDPDEELEAASMPNGDSEVVVIVRPEEAPVCEEAPVAEAEASGEAPSRAAAAPAKGFSGRDSATRGLPDGWKQLLRKAYRVLQSEDGDLFDFTKSYSATVNRAAAEVIISRAVAMSNKSTPDVRSWRHLFMRYLEQWYRKTLKPTHSKSASRAQLSMDKKLSQRQRSLDSLAAQGRLEPAAAARMADLLARREFVSSDEEEPDGFLYVKQLPWETPEAARLKTTLDGHFAESLAGPRERQELSRVRRHPGYVSSRRPPERPPDWAVSRDFL